MGSKAGQNKLAKSLFNAFREYKKASDNKVAAVEGVRKKAGKEVEETSFEENTADETEDFVAEQETDYPVVHAGYLIVIVQQTEFFLDRLAQQTVQRLQLKNNVLFLRVHPASSFQMFGY